MKVTLVSITQPTVTDNAGRTLTPEELIVYCARVSNPNNQGNMDTAHKLLKYCIDNGHWSIFEQVNIGFEVVTSRAISAQILRHWSIKPQEFSQRYAEVVEIEPIEIRMQGATNRQSSEDVFDPIINLKSLGSMLASEAINDLLKLTKEMYVALLEAGVARECARMILPMASQTTLYLNGSVRSWIHFFQQRKSLHTQKEHRVIANAISDIFATHFPIISEALLTNK